MDGWIRKGMDGLEKGWIQLPLGHSKKILLSSKKKPPSNFGNPCF
jgi:hypothetical protein